MKLNYRVKNGYIYQVQEGIKWLGIWWDYHECQMGSWIPRNVRYFDYESAIKRCNELNGIE
jgi:hypothetical protein